MEDNANKDIISQQKNDPAHSAEPLQVPPSLLPIVLNRLGLTSEQAQQGLSVEEAIVKLKSSDWEERARAVRLLGKHATAPIELLEAALDDEDGTVRAAAVHAMGNMSKPAPLPRLIRALHDSDWHVREMAVFVLGKQGPRVPDEVFKIALYDMDHSVREAARYTLQRHVSHFETSMMYGQLWEKKDMQQDNDAIQINSRDSRASYAKEPYMILREQAQEYAPQEQAQEYAPQEQVYHEYDTHMSSGEKITGYSMRRSSKKWWFIIPIVALCFFIFGALSVGLLFVGSSRVAVSSARPAFGKMVPSQASADAVLALFRETQYQNIFEQEVSSGLNISQPQIFAELNTGKSMADIAAARGISIDQLRKIETGAMTNALQAMVNGGDLSQQEADGWQARNLQYPEQLDTWTSMIFTLSAPAPGSK